MLADERRQPVVHLVPELFRGDGADFAPRHLHREVQVASRGNLHNRWRWRATTAEKRGDGLDWLLRGGQTDTRHALAGQRVEALERQRQMRTAFVIGDRVNFVHDHRPHMAQRLAASLGCKQDVERFRRRHENVRRAGEHRAPGGHQRVARADRRLNLRDVLPALAGERGDFRQRPVEVLLNVVAERFQRRDVDHFGPIRERALHRLTDERVDTGQKRRQRFSGAGRRGNQHVTTGQDLRPARSLWLGRRAEAADKPVAHQRMRPVEAGSGQLCANALGGHCP